MKINFDISPKEFYIIRDILQKHLTTDCKVWVFGSRAKNQTKYNSDLDIALEHSTIISPMILASLRDDLDDSLLPYQVDIIDINEVATSFKQIINTCKIPFPISLKKNIPRLRFKDDNGNEFKGEWSVENIKNIAEVCRGRGLSKASLSKEGYKCILYGELFTQYQEFTSTIKSRTSSIDGINCKYGDILMPSSDVTPDGLATATAVLENGVRAGSDINIIRLKKGKDAKFFSYNINLQRKEIIRLVSGTTVKHIYPKDIKGLIIAYPSLKEQQKIANFLTAIDNRVKTLEKKKTLLEQYKKGVMQKIFKQELRFKDDNGNEFKGEWEEAILGEVSEITTGSSNREDSTKEKGKYAFFDRSEDNRTSNRFLFEGEAIIVAGEGQKFTPKYFIGKFDLHQRAYAIMNFDNTVIGFFLFYSIFKNRSYFLKYAVGSTVKSLRQPIFENMPILIPSLPEQQKIANFLSSIDKKIKLTNKKIKHTKSYKKGLLQQMLV